MNSRRLKIPVKSWGAAFAAAVVFFWGLRPGWVRAMTRQEVHGLFLASQGVEVVVEEREGRKQVAYQFENEHKVITDDGFVKARPDTERGEIVWMALIESNWQIFRHNLLTEETMQLTSFGNNANPRVSGGRIVWESQIGGVWQVMLWADGELRQVTSGNAVASDVDIDQEWLVYRRQSGDKHEWRVVLENLVTGEKIDMGVGNRPRFEDGELVWGVERDGREVTERFSLRVVVPTPTTGGNPTPPQSPGVEVVPTIEEVKDASEEAVLEQIEASGSAGASESATLEE